MVDICLVKYAMKKLRILNRIYILLSDPFPKTDTKSDIINFRNQNSDIKISGSR